MNIDRRDVARAKVPLQVQLLSAIFLFMLGCRHVSIEPIYSTVPAAIPYPSDEVQEVTLRFRFKEESATNVMDTVSNGWHVVTGLPLLDNYEAVSNYWYGQGMESYYVSNVIYYRQK